MNDLGRIHLILRDKECAENIRCFIWAVWTLGLWIFIIIGGIVWFTRVEITAEDINNRRLMSGRISVVEKRLDGIEINYIHHRHRYSDGRVK